MSDLKTKRNAQLDALGVQRIVPAIIRRQIPQPGYDSQASKSELTNTTSQFADSVHRPVQIYGCNTYEPVRMRPDKAGDLVVCDKRALRSPPC